MTRAYAAPLGPPRPRRSFSQKFEINSAFAMGGNRPRSYKNDNENIDKYFITKNNIFSNDSRTSPLWKTLRGKIVPAYSKNDNENVNEDLISNAYVSNEFDVNSASLWGKPCGFRKLQPERQLSFNNKKHTSSNEFEANPLL